MSKNLGGVFRVDAEIESEVSGDSYYDPVRTTYENTIKKITEFGGAWEGGASFQMTHETDASGNLIDENYQLNVGAYMFGVQFNWDSNGLKDVRVGLDGSIGAGIFGTVTENFQLGAMYVNRPKE